MGQGLQRSKGFCQFLYLCTASTAWHDHEARLLDSILDAADADIELLREQQYTRVFH